MSAEQKQEVLDELKTALSEVPQEFHKDVSKALTHDISVIARTIGMVEKKNAPAEQAGG